MEKQQKDNETLTACVHHFKAAAKRCAFDYNTVAIDTTAGKIYKKHPQTLSEVISTVVKFNAAQQLTAMLTFSRVSMMSNSNRCFVLWTKLVILATTALMHSVMAAMNLAILHKTALARFLCQKNHVTKTGLVQGHNTPKHEGTDHTQPTMGKDIGDISTNHNHTTIPTMTRAASVPEGTHCAPHSATTVVHTALLLMDTPITTYAKTYPIPHLPVLPLMSLMLLFHGLEPVSPQQLSHTAQATSQ